MGKKKHGCKMGLTHGYDDMESDGLSMNDHEHNPSYGGEGHGMGSRGYGHGASMVEGGMGFAGKGKKRHGAVI